LLRQRVDDLEKNLNRLTQDNLTSRRQDILGIAKALHALSPLATLQRGFSVTLGPDGGVVRNTSQLLPDDIIVSRLSSGSIRSRILDLIQENNP
jgi:exodeoxyribonuclease VII large subunit